MSPISSQEANDFAMKTTHELNSYGQSLLPKTMLEDMEGVEDSLLAPILNVEESIWDGIKKFISSINEMLVLSLLLLIFLLVVFYIICGCLRKRMRDRKIIQIARERKNESTV